MLRILFVSLMVVTMAAVAPAAASPTADPVPLTVSRSVDQPSPTDRIHENGDPDDVTAWDAFTLAHDYLVAGMTLQGPLGTLFDTLRERAEADGDVPALSVTYFYRLSDGTQHALELGSYAELAAFIRTRREVRLELAREIVRRGVFTPASAYVVRGDGCAATSLRPGVVHAETWDLDFVMVQDGVPVAVAVGVADTLTVLTADASAAVLTGMLSGPVGRAKLVQVAGTCVVQLTPLDLLSKGR